MAKICKPPHSTGPVNSGEERLLRFLEARLPNSYLLVPNGEYPNKNPHGAIQYFEYDCLVVAPHAIYHIENKDWAGQLSGNDNVWYINDNERPNPHRSATRKSKILASYLKNHRYEFGRAWVETIVVLSNLGQTKNGIDPDAYCYNATFLLDDELIDFLLDHDKVNKPANAIGGLQYDIVEYLTGSSEAQNHKVTHVDGCVVDEILETTEDYIEYLCHPPYSPNKHVRIRDYQLNPADMSQKELERHRKLVHNGEVSQDKLPSVACIIKSVCRTSEDGTHYYVRSDFMEEHSLRAEMIHRTFTDLDKIKILLDVAQALSFAHEKGIVHRDVRPENIFVQNDGQAALANFGLSYNEEHEEGGLINATFTRSDYERGSYCPEEVLDGDASPASDVYAFGVIIYELMTGQPLPITSHLDLIMKGGSLTAEMLPSSQNPDVDAWVDEVCRRTIVADVSQRWSDINEVRTFIEEKALSKYIHHTSTPGEQSFCELKPGDSISNEVTLDEQLGEGGYSKVFKAVHRFQPGKKFAAKIFREGVSSQATIDEFRALKNLNHPNIVKFDYNGETHSGLFYTLMDYVNGEDLRRYTKPDMHFPLPLVMQLAKEMLSAMVYMQDQEPPVIHRDIKPENIVYEKNGHFVLIDFNIATDDESDRTKVGTYHYLAPDLARGRKMAWNKSADPFALGVTLYELVAYTYPWPMSPVPVLDKKPVDVLKQNSQISPEFAAFIMKAVETREENRFGSAREMLDALNQIESVQRKPDVIFSDADCEEYDTVNYINSLYSQSVRGNAGTRSGWKAESLLEKMTYTETLLDKKLLKDILANRYRLVIITGNAGDGKTAFIRHVEAAAGDRESIDSRNGARFTIDGISYESNYDGSQDENGCVNDEVLTRFFQPFANIEDFCQASEGRLIAINEGRLVEFLESHPEHHRLYDAIDTYFYKEGMSSLPEGVMVINLNLRSVTATTEQGESLLRKQVKALTDRKLWTKCRTCPLADRCFIKYNVDSLADSAVGNEIINRLEWIVRTISYKRELHITMRDLRSMIAWMLTRDYTCADIAGLLQRDSQVEQDLKDATDEKERERLTIKNGYLRQEKWLRYYFNVTAPINAQYYPELLSEDRLVRLLQETDIASVSLPDRDRDLYFKLLQDIDYLAFAERQQSLIEQLNEVRDIKPSYDMYQDEITLLKQHHQTLIRYQYFEGKADYLKRLPYKSIERFRKDIMARNDQHEQIKEEIAYAISASEGCWNKQLSAQHLLLSSNHVADPSAKSYRRFPLSDFELVVDTNERLTSYLEYEPDGLVFRSKRSSHVALNITLDLYEMLYYIERGFSPSVNDLKGRFIELQVFKNLLESETYTEVVVTGNDKNYYRIRLDKDTMHLMVEPLKMGE